MRAMTDYRADLNRRYWEYWKDHLSRFPDVRKVLERSRAQDTRPPVFLRHEAWRNVLVNPRASQLERDSMLGFVQESDRHTWFGSMNSSQALAQSVFANLAVCGLLNSLAEIRDDEGRSLLGKARIARNNFAMEVEVDWLGEPRPTSLDAYVSGGYPLAVECKFAEAEMGACSRPKLPRKNPECCDGSYSRQRGRKTRCSLTEIGVRYWDYVPSLFNWKSARDLSPCPLRNNYQLVRNVLAVATNPNQESLSKHGHVLLIYDNRNPAFQPDGKGLASYVETRATLREPNMLRKCSWQRLIQHLRDTGSLPWLTEQLAHKYGF